MKNDADYYIGLDIGTNSVGWAVTDLDYNILDFRRKAMWGVHLFEEGKTAKERRTFRIARRRLRRRKRRISLLRELFNREISKVDVGFFQRLDESNLHPEDRENKHPFSLFGNTGPTDREFYKKFPTAFHLRKHLMESTSKEDIRLVYLAIQHIIKNRGHFLFKNVSDDEIPPFEDLMQNLLDYMRDEFDFQFEDVSIAEAKDVIADKSLGIIDGRKKLREVLGVESKDFPRENEMVNMLVGGKADLQKIFDDENLKGLKLSFNDGNYEEKYLEHEDEIGEERALAIQFMKQIHDWSVLSGIMKDFESISHAKVFSYEQHAKDLKALKSAVKKYAKDRYNEVFKSPDVEGNYASYSYVCGKGKPNKKCNQETFCKYIRSVFKNTAIDTDPEFSEIVSRYTDNTLCPLQISRENAILPSVVHRKELIKILENASKHYPFLNEIDADGISVREKVLLIHEFNIPFYVGPLDDRSERAWLVRNSNEEVTPWNIERVVDLDETSEKFIEELTNLCSYLAGEPVLPKQSLLYSRYMLNNELNNIRINGERINPRIKKNIVEDLFRNVDKPKNVTEKVLRSYLKTHHGLSDEDEITGFDKNIKANLKSEIDFRKLIGDKVSDYRMVDDIIRIITIFGDNAPRIRKKLSKDYSDKLTKEEIAGISRLRYTKWGRLSRKLLSGIRGPKNSEYENETLIQVMENTNKNFMELVSAEPFKGLIEEHNRSLTQPHKGKLSYSMVNDTYASPPVKRSVWRTLKIVDEIISIMGRTPKKIFVETTRAEGRKERTQSRKDMLAALFKNCKETAWQEEVEKRSEGDFRAQNLFLYYLQMGKCMYCGKKMDLAEINNSNLYDRDHIYPRSKTKDDSIHNNIVLVCREHNQEKGDRYPLPGEWRKSMMPFWGMLKNCKLLGSEKYSRLVRSTGLSDEEFSEFIARQIVETGQSSKITIEALKNAFGKEVDMIYVKSRTVSDFRKIHSMFKCRSINDLHHAEDAYLNIVAGNVYDVKFTRNPSNFISSRETYNLGKMYDFDVSRGDICAWIAGEEGTVGTVRKYMRRGNAQFTKRQYVAAGKLYDDTIYRKSKNLAQVKTGMDTEKYGGRKGSTTAYFCVVDYTKGKKTTRSVEVVNLYDSRLLKTKEDLEKYIQKRHDADDVTVIVPVLKIGSLLEVDGAKWHLNGSAGDRLGVSNASQFIISGNFREYCRKIEKYMGERLNKKGQQEVGDITRFGFSPEANVSLYQYFMEKARKKPYKNAFSAFSKTISKSESTFEKLEIDDQIYILHQVLIGFQCNSVLSDLTKIKGPRYSNRNTKPKKITESETSSFKIINQSITGLFENELELFVK